MALKQYRNYYRQIEKMYFELTDDLKEVEEELKKGECTEDEFNNLMLPVRNLLENYKRLSYGMYLLYQPNRESKKSKYEKQNKYLKNYFEENNLTQDQEINKSKDDLKKFKELVKEFKLKHGQG